MGEVLFSGQALKKVEEFKHLGSVLQGNGDISADVTQRITGSMDKMEAGKRDLV